MNFQNEREPERYFEMAVQHTQSPVQKEDDLTAVLLVKPQNGQNDEEENQGFFSRFFFKRDEAKVEQRIIYLDGKVYPGNSVPNAICNQKYDPLTFLPMVLFQQFRYFFNFFFLCITLSQFIPLLKVGFLFSYLAPLLFVLTLTICKEGYDDLQRYRRDKEANSQTYQRIDKDSSTEIPSSQIRVGDIIEICGNQRVPSDCILLSCNDPTGLIYYYIIYYYYIGSVFIRTDQLDGETDWKLRKAIRYTQTYAKNKNLRTLNASVTAQEPKLDIYDFVGVFKLEVGGGEGLRESLSLENTLWCNTYVAAGKVMALVVYTGKQTRSSLNSREPRSKIGRLDLELNHLSKFLCIFMCILAFCIVFLQGFNDIWYLLYFRQVLLLASIIPISLRVNLDFAKMYFSIGVNNDQDIVGTIARNSTIPEELGRVSYIMTDKTGTLTQNQMIFKKISLERIQFSEVNIKALKKIVKKQCVAIKYPMSDIIERATQADRGSKQRVPKRSKESVTRDIITALALCHNVTPTMEDGVRTFQASSPDEIALVNIAESVGMKLLYRDTQKVNIMNASGIEETYDILYEFPFTSDRKRMGIILRTPDQRGVIVYLKGADTVMKSKVPEVQRGFLMDECEMLSREGLRTLVITQKFMIESDYQQWARGYEDAKGSLEGRDAKCKKSLELLELDMELLGITGVEDMLQEDIQHTIESLRNAGIAVWMLTGDKVETAQCIAISTGLKAPTQEMFVIKDTEDSLTLQNLLNSYGLRNNSVLVIDGISLQVALTHLKLPFLQVACKSPSVVCCRCSPTQKAEVTEAIKEFTQKLVLSIGDGGNDVAMIQAADIGVGIVGKEGKQAALASDYSILKFKYVKDLLLWHGRLAYTRTSVMAQFVMHRGLVISIIQVIFCMIFYFVSIPVYNGWLMLGYATVYTCLPVLCLIFDQDVNKQKALEYCDLYRALLKGRELTEKTFMMWLWKSIYQGTSIMALTFYFFGDTFLDLVTITFSSLILIEMLNVYSELNRIRLGTILAQFGTLGVYVLTLVFLNEYINLSKITPDFIKHILILVLISWFPLHLAKTLMRKFYPSESEKVMKKIKVRS